MAKKLSNAQIKKLTHNMPKTLYPQHIEDWYYTEIVNLSKVWHKIAMDYITLIAKVPTKTVVSDNKNDKNPTWVQRISNLLDKMIKAIEGGASIEILDKIASRFVNSVNNFEYQNIKRQTAKFGLTPVKVNEDIEGYIASKIKENVALIKTLNGTYKSQIERMVYQYVNHEIDVPEMTDAISKYDNMTVNHARLIARDQAGKITGQMDTYRAKKAGAEKYIWQSVEDDRVRERHQELDRTVQRYDDPDGGDDGELPGEPIQCRCVALPIFDDFGDISD